MSVKNTLCATVILIVCFASCKNANKNTSEQPTTTDTLAHSKTNTMNSYVALFEIPVNDMGRAIHFYQAILDLNIESMEMPDMEIGILPYEGQVVPGVLIKANGYTPSANGVTIYLNGGDNLQVILDKVETNGGKIITPKTAHADGNGFFALFLDTEGNKMGLHSPN